MGDYLPTLKLYISSLFDPQSYLDLFRAGPKGIAKAIGIGILFLYIVGSMAFLPISSGVITYQALKPLGLESLVIFNGVVMATFLTLALGFITAFTTYFLTGAESYLLALPLKPRGLLAAKLALVYLTECAITLLMLGSTLGVYAWFERPGPFFYFSSLIIILTTPLLPIVLTYIILVPLFSFVRFLRRKEVIFLAAGLLSLILMMGWQLFYQQQMSKAQDPAWLIANLSNPDSLMVRFTAVYPPARWAAGALSVTKPMSVTSASSATVYLFQYLASQLTALVFALLVLSKAYVSSLASYGEALVKRLKDSSAFISVSFRRSSQFIACLRREIVTMLNEPAYLFNGPFVVLLVPALFSFMYLTMRDEVIRDLPFLADPSAIPIMVLAAAGFSAFLGSMTSIAATGLSREGKQLAFIKSLPLQITAYWGAKYVHSLIYAVLAAIIGPVLISLIAPIGWRLALQAGLSGFSVAALINLLGLTVDTANPRLDWASPTIAVKQNPNTLITIILSMGIVAVLAYLGYLNLSSSWFLPLVASLCLTLSVGLFYLLLPWAGRRLVAIE